MKHHNIYSATDIDKYRKGQLSPAEMHAMEKAALEDPFLADAMEGFATSPDIHGDINELKERLHQRVQKERRGTPFLYGNWWKVAAILVVVAGGVWMYSAMNSKQPERSIAADNVAKKAPAVPKQELAIPDSQAIKSERDTALRADSHEVAMAPEASKNTGSYFKTTTIPRRTPGPAYKKADRPAPEEDRKVAGYRSADSAPALAPAKPTDNNIGAATPGMAVMPATTIPARRSRQDTVTYFGIGSQRRDSSLAEKESLAKREALAKGLITAKDNADKSVKETKLYIRGRANNYNTYNGRVLDNANQPITGASVIVTGRQQSVATDSQGNFTIVSPDTAVKLSVASVGFEQKNVTLYNSNNIPAANQIVLQPSSASLDEVVVVGYGPKKKKSVTGSVSSMKVNVLDAEPIIGWDEYSAYLEKNKKVPIEAAGIHGYVVVRFTVDSKGTLKNFSIEKSLQAALDEEAIRLVKNGPAWRVLKGKKTKASVMVGF